MTGRKPWVRVNVQLLVKIPGCLATAFPSLQIRSPVLLELSNPQEPVGWAYDFHSPGEETEP